MRFLGRHHWAGIAEAVDGSSQERAKVCHGQGRQQGGGGSAGAAEEEGAWEGGGAAGRGVVPGEKMEDPDDHHDHAQGQVGDKKKGQRYPVPKVDIFLLQHYEN